MATAWWGVDGRQLVPQRISQTDFSKSYTAIAIARPHVSSVMPSTTDAPRRFHFGSLLSLGFVTDFLDTLGVGSFATTSTVLTLGSVVEDVETPGIPSVRQDPSK